MSAATATLLIEASRLSVQRQRARAERRMEGRVGAMFTRQGRLLRAEMPQMRPYFMETVPVVLLNRIWLLIEQDTESEFRALLGDEMAEAFRLASDGLKASLDLTVRWNVVTAGAEEWISQQAAQRVTAINETTRQRLATLLKTSADEGWNYTETARAITEKFQGFSKKRARLVAVTEFGDAFEEGTLKMAQTFEARGWQMQKQWLTSRDGRVTGGCKANAKAGWIGLDEAYPSGHQRPLRFPGCRCTQQLRRIG